MSPMWNDLLDLSFVEEVWDDASTIDPKHLERLFIAAHEVCVAYAPLLVAGAPVPESYRLAEIMQARHLWGQIGGGNAESRGGGEFETPVYPLVFAARDLLRPKRSPLSRLR